MALSITHTPVYCTDLNAALDFYTRLLGFEVHDDVPMGPEMRWLTVHAPGDGHDLLLAAVDHHIPPADRQAMRELVAKGDLAVFIQVDDLDKTFHAPGGAPSRWRRGARRSPGQDNRPPPGPAPLPGLPGSPGLRGGRIPGGLQQ